MTSTATIDLMKNFTSEEITAQNVHSTLKKYMIVDGFEFVLDLNRSQGSFIFDQKTGTRYIDFFTFFASSPVGINHPKMKSPEVMTEFASYAVNKPSNSDIFTVPMAEFVDTFTRIAKPDYMKHIFFVSGGTLAVENGLKTAFDWKVQKNFRKGYKEEKGHQVIHFREAFHGRSGYTLSLTNTDLAKINYFPKFKWPRISNPKLKFPLTDLKIIKQAEDEAVNQIYAAIKNNPDDIAVIIIEPVQAEGGDNFFRKEFFTELRNIADENEILLMFDEVQTGFGLTGKFWAYEHFVKPDIIAFGKKAQVCGILVNDRIDDIDTNCFKVPSRINSTWGSDLTDMIRAKHFLKIIHEEDLVSNAAVQGNYLLGRLYNLQRKFPAFVSNARGLGLMCSFDLPSKELRNEFRKLCYSEKLLILGCGEKSVRFRPALNVTREVLDSGLEIIENILFLMTSKN